MSKHTLFYYDKEGVFSPVKKSENGFRNYSTLQIETFFVIKSLKDMGVSLSEIKEYMITRSPQNCTALLREHEKKLEEEMKNIKNTIKLIKEKQVAIQEYFNNVSNEVQVVYEKKEILFITESEKEDYYSTFAKHIKKSNDVALNFPCAVGHIIKNEDFFNKTYFDYYFSKSSAFSTNTLIKPEGEYLRYYHENGYLTIDEGYEKIFEYAKMNSINLGEYFYEYMVLDELSVDGIENYVIKLTIAILK